VTAITPESQATLGRECGLQPGFFVFEDNIEMRDKVSNEMRGGEKG
jgi:hypothetical protein